MTDYYSLHERITCRPFLKLFEIFPFYPLSCLLNNLFIYKPLAQGQHSPKCPSGALSTPSFMTIFFPSLTVTPPLPPHPCEQNPNLSLFNTFYSSFSPCPSPPSFLNPTHLLIYIFTHQLLLSHSFPTTFPFLFAGPSLNLRSTL